MGDRAFDVATQLFLQQDRPGWCAVTDLRRLELGELDAPDRTSKALALGELLRSWGMHDAAADADVVVVERLDEADGVVAPCLRRLGRLPEVDLRRQLAAAAGAHRDGDHPEACAISRAAMHAAVERLTGASSLDVRCALIAQRDRIMRVGLASARSIEDPNFIVDVLAEAQMIALHPPNARAPSVVPEAMRAVADDVDELQVWRRIHEAVTTERTAPAGGTHGDEGGTMTLADLQVHVLLDDGRALTFVHVDGSDVTYDEAPPRQTLLDLLRGHAALLQRLVLRGDASDRVAVERSASDVRSLLPLLDGDDELRLAPTGALFAAPWTSVASRPIRVVADLTHDRASNGMVTVVTGPHLATAEEEVIQLQKLLGDRAHIAAPGTELTAMIRATGGTVHLCCHGHHDADNPLLSEYELTGGPLSAVAIERAGLAPALVVAAACRAGASEPVGATTSIGLPTAWLAAGASTVVAPVCAIPDDERTVRTMVAVHQALADGASPERAVAAARRGGDPDVARTLVVVGRLPDRRHRQSPGTTR